MNDLLRIKSYLNGNTFYLTDRCSTKGESHITLFQAWPTCMVTGFRYVFELGLYCDARYAFMLPSQPSPGVWAIDRLVGQLILETIRPFFNRPKVTDLPEVQIVAESSYALMFESSNGKRVTVNSILWANVLQHSQLDSSAKAYYSFKKNDPLFVCSQDGQIIAIIMPLTPKGKPVIRTEPVNLSDKFVQFDNTVDVGRLDNRQRFTTTIKTSGRESRTLRLNCGVHDGSYVAFVPQPGKIADITVIVSRRTRRQFVDAITQFARCISNVKYVGEPVVAIPEFAAIEGT